jgi:hypothetical protein
LFYLSAPGILHPQPIGLGGDERRSLATLDMLPKYFDSRSSGHYGGDIWPPEPNGRMEMKKKPERLKACICCVAIVAKI